MPSNEQTKSLDRCRQEAVAEVERRLVEMGVNPEAAETRAKAVADRIYVGDKGPIRVLTPFSRGDFYPGTWEDPLAPLVGEIFRGIGPEEKLVAVEQNLKAVAEIAEQLAASGVYRDL